VAPTQVALLGSGIAYSASPAMQNAAFSALGLTWRYSILDLAPEQLADAVDALRQAEWAGANVTIPYKVAVMEHLDRIEAEAEEAGAVNTVFKQGSSLVGRNTDVLGLRQGMKSLGHDPELAGSGLKVLVLGGGGGARAVAVALRAAQLTWVLRGRRSGFEPPGEYLSWSQPNWWERARAADLLVNATPLGRAPGSGEELVRALPEHGGVIDLVYAAGGTPLVRAGRSGGSPVYDGWELLLAQGAAAFESWTGLKAPLQVMRQALEI